MLEKVKFQYILLSAVELPFACFSIHLKGESEIAYVRASILVLSRAYAIEDLFCVTHSGRYKCNRISDDCCSYEELLVYIHSGTSQVNHFVPGALYNLKIKIRKHYLNLFFCIRFAGVHTDMVRLF